MQSGQLLGDCCYTTGSVLLAPARKQFCQLSVQLLVAGLRRGPDVPFGAVDCQSDIFQTQVVIHPVSQLLFAAQIMLGRLNGCVTKQELNLFKFSPSQVA